MHARAMLVAALLATGALLHGGAAPTRGCRSPAAAMMAGAYDYSARSLSTGDVTPLADYEVRTLARLEFLRPLPTAVRARGAG